MIHDIDDDDDAQHQPQEDEPSSVIGKAYASALAKARSPYGTLAWHVTCYVVAAVAIVGWGDKVAF